MNERQGLGGRSAPVIKRLHALHPRLIDLSLGRLQVLLAKLGHPERQLPPVIHVAGTNGKGSTCAFLRGVVEAAGQRAHVYTSPHLVHFHERIRLAGALVGDDALTDALEATEAANAGAAISVFEVITAAALLLFSRVPADALILEVGLGGRFDATNVVERPVVTAITSISMDHMDLLGDTLAKIAFEKAGIIKPGVPCVTGVQAPEAMAVLRDVAGERGAALTMAAPCDLPLGLAGPHQADNAGIAVAALRAWNPAWLTEAAIRDGLARATWPARLQRLHGALAARAAPHELWLDGGHNAGAGAALAAHLPAWADAPLHLLVGMKAGKGAADFLRPLLPFATTLWAVREPGQHLAMEIGEIVNASGGVARVGGTVEETLGLLPHAPTGRVLVCGSLYLAGEVLKAEAG